MFSFLNCSSGSTTKSIHLADFWSPYNEGPLEENWCNSGNQLFLFAAGASSAQPPHRRHECRWSILGNQRPVAFRHPDDISEHPSGKCQGALPSPTTSKGIINPCQKLTPVTSASSADASPPASWASARSAVRSTAWSKRSSPTRPPVGRMPPAA